MQRSKNLKKDTQVLPQSTKDIFLTVNEFNFFYLLALNLRKRPLYYIDIETYFFPSKHILSWILRNFFSTLSISNYWKQERLLLRNGEIAPGFYEFNHADFFLTLATSNPKVQKLYPVNQAIKTTRDIVKKKIAHQYLKNKVIQSCIVFAILKNKSNHQQTLKVFCTNEEAAILESIISQEKKSILIAPYASPAKTLFDFLNFTCIKALIVFRCLQALTRIKKNTLSFNSGFLMNHILPQENLGDYQVFGMLEERDGPSAILVNPSLVLHPLLIKYQTRGNTILGNLGGFLSFKDLRKIFTEFQNGRFEYLQSTEHSPVHLRCKFFASIYKEIQIRIHENALNIKHLWNTHEYDVGHIIRTMVRKEFNRVTIGRIHGLPITGHYNIWKHTYYDFLFVYGPDIKSLLQKEIPIDNKIIVGGSWSSLHYLKESTKIKREKLTGIVYLQSPMNTRGIEILTEYCMLAQRNPSRTFYISPKKGDVKIKQFEYELSQIGAIPKNIEICRENSYSVLNRCRFALSAGSTITAEAIQLGVITFTLDIDDTIPSFYYKRFPQICIESTEQFWKKIREIELSQSEYPFIELNSLIPTTMDRTSIFRNELFRIVSPPNPQHSYNQTPTS